MKDMTGNNVSVGMRFGKYTVSGKHQTKTCILWDCVCDCGRHRYFSGDRIVFEVSHPSKFVLSCGTCRRSPNVAEYSIRRRMFMRWETMKSRCHNPNNPAYKDYGGRGIEVCTEWRDSFDLFFQYVSSLEHFNEPGRSIDRIDNNDGYRPGNVRWATAKEQVSNQRTRKKGKGRNEQGIDRSKEKSDQKI